ncbi:nucleic-acid-binding protein from mobile element jockey [Plakobranchus ocellatus]|uniref:Nucleic-acid-binding protein from mobile element jockey n=1 Tax=Plakobranchus ocellatus TaxID=259542 RepID=A0AAV4C2T4_9GAST|nr:nucleic-acid-binding protein from mobile element jockey [Plakobranchus ocellatus]
MTVSPHKSLNSSKGVIRSRDLRCCSEEELSGVTHARRIKVRRGEDKIQTDTVVLTFDSPKPPSRIRAGYLTLDVRPYVPLPMRCYKCQRYGHGKDRCKKPAAVCVRCGKGGHVERDCSADPHCVNCKGDHTASSKTCPKFLEEQVILRYKAENGGTFQQARKAVVELHKTISTRTFASAVKSQLRTKPAALPKDGGRSAPSAPPKGKKAQKDSPAPSPQGAAETEVPAKRRAEKSKRQETPRETFNRIQGNENVDKLAKAALNRTSTSRKLICYSDLKPKINTYIKSVWQRDWDAEGANKLHEVLPNLDEDLHRRGEGAGRKRETAMC